MELRQLRQFVMLAETCNFHRAAERLNMAQPPLSVSIRKLETELGVRLFNRSSRGVSLTEAGSGALREAKAALFHIEETARIARAVDAGEAGRLRIGFVGSATYALLPRLLPLFRARYPDVALELQEGTNGQIVAMLEAHTLDIGIVRMPFRNRHAIRCVTIERDVLIAALWAGHPLANKRRLALRDLADEPFVHYAAGEVGGMRAVTTAMFQDAGFSPGVAQEAVQVDTVISLVESRLGVALVPSIAASRASKAVVFRKLADASASATIGIALAYDPRHDSSTAKRFRALAIEKKGR